MKTLTQKIAEKLVPIKNRLIEAEKHIKNARQINKIIYSRLVS